MVLLQYHPFISWSYHVHNTFISFQYPVNIISTKSFHIIVIILSSLSYSFSQSFWQERAHVLIGRLETGEGKVLRTVEVLRTVVLHRPVVGATRVVGAMLLGTVRAVQSRISGPTINHSIVRPVQTILHQAGVHLQSPGQSRLLQSVQLRTGWGKAQMTRGHLGHLLGHLLVSPKNFWSRKICRTFQPSGQREAKKVFSDYNYKYIISYIASILHLYIIYTTIYYQCCQSHANHKLVSSWFCLCLAWYYVDVILMSTCGACFHWFLLVTWQFPGGLD